MAMTQIRIFVTITLLFVIGLTHPVFAEEKEAGETASFSALQPTVDDRTMRLSAYFASMHSPLEAEADHFIYEADRLGIDWTLLPAISGVESTFGRHVPTNSYNAWGWAIFTGKSDGRHFESWRQGITIVAEGIKENYVNRGRDTVETIGPIYATDRTWAWKVRYFMNKISQFTPASTDELSVAL